MIQTIDPSLACHSADLTELGINDIMRLLPHRYPFLLIDKVVDLVKGERACGIKNVTINEPFFQGHFPGHPIMPGVLIIEAMAQTAGALVMHSLGIDQSNHVVYFMSVQEAKFRLPVTPGDRLLLQVHKVQHRQMVWKFEGRAVVNDRVYCEATFTAQLTPKK